MKYLMITIALLLLTGCNVKSQEQYGKRIKVNGLICPEGFSTPQQANKDLTECNYYDEKAAAEASKSQIGPDCKKCLEEKGYELE